MDVQARDSNFLYLSIITDIIEFFALQSIN